VVRRLFRSINYLLRYMPGGVSRMDDVLDASLFGTTPEQALEK